jgi:hypothetical protein
LFLLAGRYPARRRRFVRLLAYRLALPACAAPCFDTSALVQGYRTDAEILLQPFKRSRLDIAVSRHDSPAENGQTESYWLAGDEVYVDAHILKWKPG